MKIERFTGNPIIRPNMDRRMGDNINGPSLVKVPEWVSSPLGRYYLYFAHHQGNYIRLAYADDLHGPWRIYEPGTLQLGESYYAHHIASPDVRIDDHRREIRMYYHGADEDYVQTSRVAVSSDGLRFQSLPDIIGESYFRVSEWGGWHYALAMPGIFYRSGDGLTNFQREPELFTEHMRHSALRLRNGILEVFYSNAGDCPERILMSTIDLSGDWMDWRASEPVTVLEPEMEYEGADLLLEASVRGLARERVRQLRDPAIYQEDERTYLLYSVAGESGIAIAEVLD